MARARPATPLLLDTHERQELLALSRARTKPVRLVERSHIILLAADGLHERRIAQSVRVSPRTVRRWCETYRHRRAEDPESSVAQRLADRSRVGRPDHFDEYFWIDVLAMATATPESFGRPITHWTLRELTDEIIQRHLTESIHYTTVGRFCSPTACGSG